MIRKIPSLRESEEDNTHRKEERLTKPNSKNARTTGYINRFEDNDDQRGKTHARTISPPTKREEKESMTQRGKTEQEAHPEKPLRNETTVRGGKQAGSCPADKPRTGHIRTRDRRLFGTGRHTKSRNDRTEPVKEKTRTPKYRADFNNRRRRKYACRE